MGLSEFVDDLVERIASLKNNCCSLLVNINKFEARTELIRSQL